MSVRSNRNEKVADYVAQYRLRQICVCEEIEWIESNSVSLMNASFLLFPMLFDAIVMQVSYDTAVVNCALPN